MSEERHNGRTWLQRGLLVALGGILGLGLAELGLRLSGFAPPDGLYTVTESEFERVPGTFAPDQQVVEAEGSTFEHRVTINSLGYRGADFQLTKPPTEFRVLFAGDSFTWGHNVDDHETLPAQLQERLEERCTASLVANAGVSGTSILAHQAIINRGLAIDPDLVILMYHENDIDELVHARMWEQLATNRRIKSRFPLSVVYPVVRTSALWYLAQHVRRVLRARGEDVGRDDVETTEAGADQVDEDVETARSEYASRLRAVKDTLAEHGLPFLFVTFPHPDSVEEGDGGRDYDWVLDLARRLNIPTLDLLPQLRSGPLSIEEAYLVPRDYHPSAEGHGFAAEIIADLLAGKPSLTDDCVTSR